MIEHETFEIPFKYKGQDMNAEVRTLMPNGPDNADHEIWMHGDYLFTINPHEDECDELCWKSKEADVDLEFVRVIGDAIERHYL